MGKVSICPAFSDTAAGKGEQDISSVVGRTMRDNGRKYEFSPQSGALALCSLRDILGPRVGTSHQIRPQRPPKS